MREGLEVVEEGSGEAVVGVEEGVMEIGMEAEGMEEVEMTADMEEDVMVVVAGEVTQGTVVAQGLAVTPGEGGRGAQLTGGRGAVKGGSAGAGPDLRMGERRENL